MFFFTFLCKKMNFSCRVSSRANLFNLKLVPFTKAFKVGAWLLEWNGSLQAFIYLSWLTASVNKLRQRNGPLHGRACKVRVRVQNSKSSKILFCMCILSKKMKSKYFLLIKCNKFKKCHSWLWRSTEELKTINFKNMIKIQNFSDNQLSRGQKQC